MRRRKSVGRPERNADMWALITSPRRKRLPKQPNAAAAWKFFALIQE
jgi:hypothetical protein